MLNKASEVSPEEYAHLVDIVRALQPKAEIIPCDYGNVDLDLLLNTHRFDFDEVATSAAWIDEIEHHHGDEHIDDDDDDEDEHEHHEHEHEHEHHHHDHDHEHCHCHHHDHEGGEVEEYGIGTFVYYARRPMDMNFFDNFVCKLWPKSVIRCKGLCWFKNEPDMCYIFEQAGRQIGLKNAGQWYATMPEDELLPLLEREEGLRRDWDEKYGDRMQKLVFIGQKMDKKAICDALDMCLTD